MSPEREIDETKGGKPDEKIVEQAAEAKAEQEAKTPRRRRRRKAEDTEVAAAAEEQAKPRRRRRRKADDEEAEGAEPKAEASGEDAEEPEAKDGEDEATDEDGPTPNAQRPTPEDEDDPTPNAQRPTPAQRQPTDVPVAVRAHARYVRTSARKARLVCDHIRGKPVPEARAILGFTPRAAARDWSKVLESAVANAEANHELIGDELKVAEAYADEGPTLKRYRPRAMGRATRIRKRTSHLTITLAPAANESKERSR
jgi:ribosomal protein L22